MARKKYISRRAQKQPFKRISRQFILWLFFTSSPAIFSLVLFSFLPLGVCIEIKSLVGFVSQQLHADIGGQGGICYIKEMTQRFLIHTPSSTMYEFMCRYHGSPTTQWYAPMCVYIHNTLSLPPHHPEMWDLAVEAASTHLFGLWFLPLELKYPFYAIYPHS